MEPVGKVRGGALDQPALQRNLGPLQNFFLPSAQLVEKRREGSRRVRRQDRPQAACQRWVSSGQRSKKQARR